MVLSRLFSLQAMPERGRTVAISAIKTDLSRAIPKIDELVSSYVIGIEADEYWTEGEAPSIGTHMQKLTE